MVRCHGSYGCYGADIDAVNIIANGAYTLNSATIESENQVRINVYSKGYLSGMNANVICREGKICKIYCAGNGCADLNFGCLVGSQCNVSPSTCSPNVYIDELKHKDASVVNEDTESIVCPNWYLSRSKTVDYQLLSAFDDQRLDGIKNMEFDSPQNINEHLLDPMKYIKNVADNHEMKLFHSREFKPRGSIGKDDYDGDMDMDQEKVLSSNVETKKSGSIRSNIVALHSVVIEIVIFCLIYMIGIGTCFCYKGYCHSDGKRLDPQ